MRDTSHGATVAHEGYEERSVPATGVEPTRIAVAGYWGSKHVRVLSSLLPDISVTVIDEDERRLVDAARTDPSVCRSPNLGDVLDQVDGVVVATPPAGHAEVALRALCAGKHALVEKPPATSVADALRSRHVTAASLPCSLHGR